MNDAQKLAAADEPCESCGKPARTLRGGICAGCAVTGNSGSNLRPGDTATSIVDAEFGVVGLKLPATDRAATVYEDLQGFGVLPRFALELTVTLENPDLSMFAKWSAAWAVLHPRMGPATLTEWMRRHRYWVHGAETRSNRSSPVARVEILSHRYGEAPRCERCRELLPSGTMGRLSERMDGSTILTCAECTPD